MTRAVYEAQIVAELEFARAAAGHFAQNPQHSTYTAGAIEPGCFLAIRWGLGEDCVMIVKLDEAHMPTNYMEIVRQFEAKAA
jgi:hypothetical protein